MLFFCINFSQRTSQFSNILYFETVFKSNHHLKAENGTFHPPGGKNISCRGSFTFLMFPECSGEDSCGSSKNGRELTCFY